MSEIIKQTDDVIMEKIRKDLLTPLTTFPLGFKIWVAALLTMIALAAWAYTIQFNQGLGVTAMRDYVSWGIYIASFVFFVATALVGMLISAVVGLLGQKWIIPISRIAEMIALAFVMMAGVAIVVDMGRPDRVLNLLFHGRFSSPIIWDVTVVNVYIVISILLLFLPMLPDLGIIRNHMKKDLPKWQKQLFF